MCWVAPMQQVNPHALYKTNAHRTTPEALMCLNRVDLVPSSIVYAQKAWLVISAVQLAATLNHSLEPPSRLPAEQHLLQGPLRLMSTDNLLATSRMLGAAYALNAHFPLQPRSHKP